MMTQNNTASAIILTHGDLARELLATAEQIVGPQPDSVLLSNRNYSLDDLILTLSEHCTPERTIFIFTDFVGSSCQIAATRTVLHQRNCYTITGVNLAMLLNFFTKRAAHEGEDLQQMVREAGIRGIR